MGYFQSKFISGTWLNKYRIIFVPAYFTLTSCACREGGVRRQPKGIYEVSRKGCTCASSGGGGCNGVSYCSRIHRSMTGEYSQLRHRVVVPACKATLPAGQYDIPMPELTLSPSQESMNSATGWCRFIIHCYVLYCTLSHTYTFLFAKRPSRTTKIISE